MEPLERINILLVDDRPQNLLALESILGDLGHNLVKADSGAEALRALLKEEFAVILLDVQMPELDGFETAGLIRERDRTRHTPIIFITAVAIGNEFVFKGYTTGAVDYIIKPVVPEILRAKVRVFVDLHQMSRQVQRQAEQLAAANRELERRAADLAQVNRELESFSYSVSHDLRAPLRSIESFGNALIEEYLEGLDATGQDYLRRVSGAARRMRELIEDLLKLSRISRGEIQRTEVDLSRLVREVAEDLLQREPGRRVNLVVAQVPAVNGDERLLRIVFENLLGNALKYTSRHAEADIEFGCGYESGGEGVFFVRDDGAGFDMANAERLFTPFQRLHTTKEFPGTGIGLATVQRIIHRHGGRIWAEGKVETGATFYFSLGGSS